MDEKNADLMVLLWLKNANLMDEKKRRSDGVIEGDYNVFKRGVHENAYATESHHCFSLPTNLSSPAISTVDDSGLESLAIVISRLGQSCETACKLSGLTWQLSKLSAVNKCSILQKYFSCRGPCVATIDQPAQVSASAQRHMHPGACLFTTQASTLSCDAYNKHWRRLCPCA
ncbi:hypothetical protein L7F22_056002 [Adiantum nelumboides]|nr:hypothetical protein [Adiantum nelumboides]